MDYSQLHHGVFYHLCVELLVMGVIHSGGSCVSLCNPLTKFLEQCIKEKGLVGVEGRGGQSFSLNAVHSQILS